MTGSRFGARAIAILLGVFVVGCSAIKPNLLGGREKCWSDVEPRMATLMEGELELGRFPWHLATPEGETFQIDFAGLSLDSTAMHVVDGEGRALAADGELVTVFGGLGQDGVILVCGIEERHAA